MLSKTAKQKLLSHTLNYELCEVPSIPTNKAIYIFNLKGLINPQDYIDLAYEFRKKFPISNKTNIKGWHSDYESDKKFLDSRFDILKSIIEERLQKIVNVGGSYGLKAKVSNMWVNILNKDDYVSKHNHHPANIYHVFNWSAVYYCKTEDNMKPIIFEDKTKIVPKNNMLLIFAGDIFHEVKPLTTNQERISFVANSFLYGN